jgi:hypothetical protein
MWRNFKNNTQTNTVDILLLIKKTLLKPQKTQYLKMIILKKLKI